MDLLVAYRDDPAGSNMARHLAEPMRPDGDIYRGDHYNLVIIPTPAVSAGWLDGSYDCDGYVFLSKHAAESGRPALTCHSLGNFAEARHGGRARQVGTPHPLLQREYMRALAARASEFPGFHITIEATHHGPTELQRPAAFVEVGTTEAQWNDARLCGRVASVLHDVMASPLPDAPSAICFGGGHYPAKFTSELLEGGRALGTVVPRRALADIDGDLFGHILERNRGARTALVDWSGMGPEKHRIISLIESAGLGVERL